MQKFNSWEGPGRGYDHNDSADPVTTSNQRSRHGQTPFRDMGAARAVMAASGKNTGDPRVKWGEVGHAGTQHAGVNKNDRKF